MDREVRFSPPQREVLGDRPRDQDGFVGVHHLEAEVEVKSPGVVLMDQPGLSRQGLAGIDVADVRRRLRRVPERSLLCVSVPARHPFLHGRFPAIIDLGHLQGCRG
jgi:hypothetical protein